MTRTAYVVYVDYQDDRVLPEEAEYFYELEDALNRANELKNEFQYSDEWELGDEFDEGELTDTENDVVFINKKTCMKACVSIHSIHIIEKTDNIIQGVPYTSVWDDGSRTITTTCSVNMDTKEVFEIEPVSDDIEDLDICDKEYIELNGEHYAVCEKSEYDGLPDQLKDGLFYRE